MNQQTDHTPLTDEQLDEIEARAAHLFEYVTMPTEADQLAGVDVPALIAEVHRLRDELAQEQKANDRLNAVTDLCDAAEKQATRWEHPLPVPEWVTVVRHAIDPAAPVAAVSSAAEDGGQP